VIYTAVLEHIDRRGAIGRIQSTRAIAKLVPELHLYVGLPERDHFETLLELSTPLGVSSITPLICEQMGKDWWSKKWSSYTSRFLHKCIASSKQSLYPHLPTLYDPTPFKDIDFSRLAPSYFGDDQALPVFQALQNTPPADLAACFIGPPGGFTINEIVQLKHQGSIGCALSPNRLRTELATALLCASILSASQPKNITP